MLGRFEDGAAVSPLAFEHRARVVHGMGQDVHLGVAPSNEFAVEPYPAVPVVESLTRHGVLLISSKSPDFAFDIAGFYHQTSIHTA